MFVDNADGTAQREAVRRWHLNSVLPLARMVEHELSAKLETPVRLKFEPVRRIGNDPYPAPDRDPEAQPWRGVAPGVALAAVRLADAD